MALIDYKIVNFSHEGRHVSADIRIYRGAVSTESEQTFEGLVSLTRYRRTAKVLERHLEADVPRDMTRAEFLVKVRAYLNKKINDFASANGHVVITEQQDLSEYEEFLNET